MNKDDFLSFDDTDLHFEVDAPSVFRDKMRLLLEQVQYLSNELHKTHVLLEKRVSKTDALALLNKKADLQTQEELAKVVQLRYEEEQEYRKQVDHQLQKKEGENATAIKELQNNMQLSSQKISRRMLTLERLRNEDKTFVTTTVPEWIQDSCEKVKESQDKVVVNFNSLTSKLRQQLNQHQDKLETLENNAKKEKVNHRQRLDELERSLTTITKKGLGGAAGMTGDELKSFVEHTRDQISLIFNRFEITQSQLEETTHQLGGSIRDATDQTDAVLRDMASKDQTIMDLTRQLSILQDNSIDMQNRMEMLTDVVDELVDGQDKMQINGTDGSVTAKELDSYFDMVNKSMDKRMAAVYQKIEDSAAKPSRRSSSRAGRRAHSRASSRLSASSKDDARSSSPADSTGALELTDLKVQLLIKRIEDLEKKVANANTLSASSRPSSSKASKRPQSGSALSRPSSAKSTGSSAGKSTKVGFKSEEPSIDEDDQSDSEPERKVITPKQKQQSERKTPPPQRPMSALGSPNKRSNSGKSNTRARPKTSMDHRDSDSQSTPSSEFLSVTSAMDGSIDKQHTNKQHKQQQHQDQQHSQQHTDSPKSLEDWEREAEDTLGELPHSQSRDSQSDAEPERPKSALKLRMEELRRLSPMPNERARGSSPNASGSGRVEYSRPVSGGSTRGLRAWSANSSSRPHSGATDGGSSTSTSSSTEDPMLAEWKRIIPEDTSTDAQSSSLQAKPKPLDATDTPGIPSNDWRSVPDSEFKLRDGSVQIIQENREHLPDAESFVLNIEADNQPDDNTDPALAQVGPPETDQEPLLSTPIKVAQTPLPSFISEYTRYLKELEGRVKVVEQAGFGQSESATQMVAEDLTLVMHSVSLLEKAQMDLAQRVSEELEDVKVEIRTRVQDALKDLYDQMDEQSNFMQETREHTVEYERRMLAIQRQLDNEFTARTELAAKREFALSATDEALRALEDALRLEVQARKTNMDRFADQLREQTETTLNTFEKEIHRKVDIEDIKGLIPRNEYVYTPDGQRRDRPYSSGSRSSGGGSGGGSRTPRIQSAGSSRPDRYADSSNSQAQQRQKIMRIPQGGMRRFASDPRMTTQQPDPMEHSRGMESAHSIHDDDQASSVLVVDKIAANSASAIIPSQDAQQIAQQSETLTDLHQGTTSKSQQPPQQPQDSDTQQTSSSISNFNFDLKGKRSIFDDTPSPDSEEDELKMMMKETDNLFGSIQKPNPPNGQDMTGRVGGRIDVKQMAMDQAMARAQEKRGKRTGVKKKKRGIDPATRAWGSKKGWNDRK